MINAPAAGYLADIHWAIAGYINHTPKKMGTVALTLTNTSRLFC